MDDLTAKKCIPCEGDFPPMTREQALDFMEHVPGWKLADDARSISLTHLFSDFKQSIGFANKVGALAEEEGHHPDMLVSWGKVIVTLTTHSVRGLSENDFILAAKVNELP